jgi:hypothetical protein
MDYLNYDDVTDSNKIISIDYSRLVLTSKQKKLIEDDRKHMVQLSQKQRISIKLECVCGTYVSAHCYKLHCGRESHLRYIEQLKRSEPNQSKPKQSKPKHKKPPQIECICGTYVDVYKYKSHVKGKSHLRYVEQLNNNGYI